MILVLSVGFRANGFQVINTVRAFIARIFASFMSAFRASSSRSFRVRFNDGARVRISVRQIVIHGRQAYTYPSKSKLRSQDFRFHVSDFIRHNARNLSGYHAFRRGVLCTVVSRRISVTLTVARFQVIRSVMYCAIFMFSSQ